MPRRGQTAFDYLVLFAFVTLAVVVTIVLIRGPLLSLGTNQLAASAGNVFALIERFGNQPGCALGASPAALAQPGGSSTITVAYQRLTPTGSLVTINCGTGTSVNATGCPDASNGTGSCSASCAYPANNASSTAAYTLSTSVGSRTCTGIQVTVAGNVTTTPTPTPTPNNPPTVTLNSPANGATIPAGTAFSYTPTDDLGFGNATLYANFTGTWTANATNSTALANNTLNTLTTSVSAGYYVWNVRVCDNMGACSFAAANFTLNVLPPVTVGSAGQQFNAPAYYYLTGNLTGQGNGVNFTSGASGSTLNCQGFAFISGGPAYTGYGIFLNQVSNFAVTNCRATGYQSGLYSPSSPATSNALTANTFYNNTYGIYLSQSTQSTLTNNTMYNNTNYGIIMTSSTNNNLSNNTANNSLVGIYLQGSGSNNLSNNTVYNNPSVGIVGIYLTASSNNNTLTNNTASNAQYGILLESGSSRNTLTSNTANNTQYGIRLNPSSNNNTLTSNTANNNTQIGIYLVSSSNNNLSSNTAYNNGVYGIVLSFSSNSNTLANNAAYNHPNTGFVLSGSSSNNVLVNNTAFNNTPYGFYLQSSGGNNTLANNTAYSNSYGFILTGSSNNTFTSNTAYNNSQNGFNMDGLSSNNVWTSNSACPVGGTTADFFVGSSQNATSSGNTCRNTFCSQGGGAYNICTTVSATSNCPVAC